MKNRALFSFTVLCQLMALTFFSGSVYAGGSGENSGIASLRSGFINGVYRISSGGRYTFSGEHTGQILIEAARNDVVELVFDGLTLHNPNGPAILAPRSRNVEIILNSGTINTISDGKHPNDETNAAIYIQHNLTFSGNGTLNVNGNYHHGIRTQDTLTVKSGVYNIKAAGDALRGRDAVIIENGSFTLTAGGDGIQSNNDTNPDRGFITINGGTFVINSGDDGIQAEKNITINNGNIGITAKDDGITTNGSILITGGVINITDSYEGLEGLNVTITGGDITILARDDGINARDGETVNMGWGRPMMRRPLNENIFVRITGGNINVQAYRDGIDSNNNIFLEGGALYISGPSRGMEGAIDCDGVFLITGGKLVTAGSVINLSGQSTQPALLAGFNQNMPSGAIIEIRDSGGNSLLRYAAKNAFSMSAFTSPDFTIGQTYSLFINNEKVNDITLNSTITNIGSNNFRGGFDGGRGVPGGNRGGNDGNRRMMPAPPPGNIPRPRF
ncbi:MAG: carbohydrate-binding domain-containing protein [Treponema sp.]|nr:carbohydrate-binding domain-containing protein [Treponema sp.]